MKKATLLYNPIAGGRPRRRERQVREAAAALESQGIRTVLAPTTGPDSARHLARALAAQGEELIVVCGGDGTINEAINGIAPGNTTLGILPGGTANVFAKELGLPHDPVRAARELAQWSPQRIALGRTTWSAENGTPTEPRLFLSLAGVGFDAYVVHKISPAWKLAGGIAAYVLEALLQSVRYPFPSFSCRAEGRVRQATFAVVQRTVRYGGWLRMAPGAGVFQPRFSLCLFKSRHRARYFLYAAAVMARRHARLADVEIVQTQRVECEPEMLGKTIYVELDGELVGRLPATFEIVPDALTVLVPQKRRT